MNKETIYDLKPEGKTVYVRVDYNVPHDSEGHILDDRRIRATIPTMAGLVVAMTGIYFAAHLRGLAERECGRLQDRLTLGDAKSGARERA